MITPAPIKIDCHRQSAVTELPVMVDWGRCSAVHDYGFRKSQKTAPNQLSHKPHHGKVWDLEKLHLTVHWQNTALHVPLPTTTLPTSKVETLCISIWSNGPCLVILGTVQHHWLFHSFILFYFIFPVGCFFWWQIIVVNTDEFLIEQ